MRRCRPLFARAVVALAAAALSALVSAATAPPPADGDAVVALVRDGGDGKVGIVLDDSADGGAAVWLTRTSDGALAVDSPVVVEGNVVAASVSNGNGTSLDAVAAALHDTQTQLAAALARLEELEGLRDDRDGTFLGTFCWDARVVVDSSFQAPVVTGNFSRLRVAYASGAASCNANMDRDRRPFNQCAGPGGWSFDLLARPPGTTSGFTYLVETVQTNVPPPGCFAPPLPWQDHNCNVELTLVPGMTLAGSWYEASKNYGNGDNTGSVCAHFYGHKRPYAPRT